MKDLHKQFYYRDGKLYFKACYHKRFIGKRAGYLENTGYRSILYKGKKYGEQRIVFYLHHGYLPHQVDHINHDRTDNRIENLRPANPSTNKGNMLAPESNTSGYKGVNLHRGGWMARIMCQGNRIYLGTFNTKEEAALAYNEKATEVFGEYASLNTISS